MIGDTAKGVAGLILHPSLGTYPHSVCISFMITTQKVRAATGKAKKAGGSKHQATA
jgi:hypothetical protein